MRQKRLTFDAYATFNKTFDEKHDITVIAGFNQEEYRYENVQLGRKELISSSLPTRDSLQAICLSVNPSAPGHCGGGYARFNYTFDNKYIVEFNGRYDGTSRFP